MSNHPQFSPLVAQTLKLIGVILILSFLLDFAILLFPFGARDRTWQIGLATALVDRGIIPMVGMAFLIAGYWINNQPTTRTIDALTKRTASLDLKLTLLLSCLLGLLFGVFFPLHINNVRQASAEAIERINQDATQKETQLQTELGSAQAQAEIQGKQNQFRSQVSELLQNEQQFNQALQSEQLPDSQKRLLRRFKADPKALDQFLNQEFGAQVLRDRALGQIRSRKQQAEQQARTEVWKSGLRIGISSLLLSIGYIAIAWNGLRSMQALLSRSRKSLIP